MSIWVLRGLRDGIVTTKWPRRPDEYADSWRGPATVLPGAAAPGAGDVLEWAEVERLCPTGAIEAAGQLRIDQGRCILCGRCVAARPDMFAWSAGATGPAAAGVARCALVVPEEPETDEAVAAAGAALAARTAVLLRSVHVRYVDERRAGVIVWIRVFDVKSGAFVRDVTG